ncbi:hypothetical protein E3U55_14245 [Filobacillus milosensis]|uniref:Uncharacterized protein n=1 Tax=Filobacillus milosensis TaxID=94137 RepID=A0A4Y8IE42_9BACI|nr:hypothetical protein [Filobacillus milosensis]TFB14206.1 hypothetical protein E3U55_14245 [Filobacillus milosensis]
MYTLSISNKQNLPEDYQLLYYPYSITEWEIEYKPLPFSKKRKEKIRIVTNLLRKETAFFELPFTELKPLSSGGDSIIPQENYSEDKREEVAQEFIRNYYIHKKKIWSYPAVNFINSYKLYVPYAIYEDTKQDFVLHELYTDSKEPLTKHKELAHYVN